MNWYIELLLQISRHPRKKWICFGIGFFGGLIATIGMLGESPIGLINVFIGGFLIGVAFRILSM